MVVADWARFVGKTYAQVVKCNMKQKYDFQGHKTTEFTDSPTVMVSGAKTKKFKNEISPVCSTAFKSVKNVKSVTCKQNSKKLQVVQEYSGFVCHVKNRFTPLTPSIEGEGPSMADNPIVNNNGHILADRSDKSQTQSVKVSKIKNNTLKHHSSRNSETICQNSDPNSITHCQKHQKMCPPNIEFDDKYQLSLQVQNKNKEKMKQASADLTFQKWNSQNEDKFGFIPLSALALPASDKRRDMGSDLIVCHNKRPK